MAGTLQPLDQQFAIVDAQGRPTLYFTQWAQQKQIDIGTALTLENLLEYLAEHLLQEGLGIALTPSGNLDDSPSISIRNGLGLNFDAMHNLKLADTAVVPGTYGDATHVAQITVDQQGRITAVVPVAISGGGGGGANWWFNPPLASSFTLAGAVLPTLTDDSQEGLLYDYGALVAGDIQRIAYRTLTNPAGDFDLKVWAKGLMASANFSQNLCAFIMDGTGGRIQSVGIGNDGNVNVINWNGLTGFSSTPLSSLQQFNRPNWFRITKVGTAITYYISENGKIWRQLYTTTATAWLANTPNRVGFGANMNRATGTPNSLTIQRFDLTGTAV